MASSETALCFLAQYAGKTHSDVIVPGTAASHVKPVLSQLAADTEYSRVCVDNAGMSDSMYTDPETLNVKPENVVQGTGHLLRRVSGSFHPTCLLKGGACVELGLMLGEFDSEVDNDLKFGLLKPGGFPKGAKIQIKAADKSKGTSAVLKVWGADDCISHAQLDSMVADGSFGSTFEQERAPVRPAMPTKKLRYHAFINKYNPLVAGGSNGQRRLLRDANNVSLYSEDSMGNLPRFYKTMVRSTDGPRQLTYVAGVGKRGKPIRRSIESENPGERSHKAVEHAPPASSYGTAKANFLCHAAATRDNHRIDLLQLQRCGQSGDLELPGVYVDGDGNKQKRKVPPDVLVRDSPLVTLGLEESPTPRVDEQFLRRFPSKIVALKTNAAATQAGMSLPWPLERPLERDNLRRFYVDYWDELRGVPVEDSAGSGQPEQREQTSRAHNRSARDREIASQFRSASSHAHFPM